MTRTTSGGVYDKDSDDGWLQEAGFRHKRLSAGSDVSASASSSPAAGAHAIASATVRFSSTTVTELCWHRNRPKSPLVTDERIPQEAPVATPPSGHWDRRLGAR
jgi:hypothetical protein